MPATHIFSAGGGGVLAAEVERGVATALEYCLRACSFAFFTPTVPAGSRVERNYDPLLLRGNVRLVPIICVPEEFHAMRCALWTACNEYSLNSRHGT